MQKFTYHTHNNNFGIYDGHNTAAEMIERAEKLGFEEIGVSNHLIYHSNIPIDEDMFLDDYQKVEDLCKIPVLGVVLFFNDIYIEEEDSVSLKTKKANYLAGKVNVVVILLRHLSNFTDFGLMERDPRVNLYYSNNTDEIEKADIILIPGTKSTLSDMYEIRKNGVAQSILESYKKGATVMGICGGFQIMGQAISDPLHIESEIEQLPGLGLLPVNTVICKEKITRQVSFTFHDSTEICHGYEIHMGS